MGFLTVIKTLPKILVRSGGKLSFAVRRASPELLVIGGAITAVGAFAWAVYNARKLDRTLEETKAEVERIEARRNDIDDNDKPSIREWERELNKAKAQSIWKVFYLMGLPVIAFAGGLIMIGGGHMILFRRFGALSSSFAVLQSKYNKYRQMNIAEHGVECDRRYLLGIPKDGETTATITDENGNKQKVKAVIPGKPDIRNGGGMYTFVFSEEFTDKWNRDPIMNISFLKSQEGYWNAYLGTGKVVILKNVLDDLGIELDPDDPANDYTMIAGWRPNGDGDCKIDFGINDPINKPTLDLHENYIVLNFNCDGNLYHSPRYDKSGRRIADPYYNVRNKTAAIA